MKHLVDSVRSSLALENWYAALSLALTLPDICGRLESPELRSQRRYVQWCKTYLEPKYTAPGSSGARLFLSGKDCYALRCAVLHEGQDDIVDQRAKEALGSFAFTTPFPGVFMHCNQVDNKLQLQVDRFCLDICAGVDAWMKEVSGRRSDVQDRMGKLMLLQDLAGSGTIEI
ncbi:hypothetical protein ACIPWF_00860 [Paenarthrobacter sp. NPDC089989]|uniref:hypothetical protein n=1 Tax=unclassified Paenarthrobacter TaxID=2634190 RepID=UPI0038200237